MDNERYTRELTASGIARIVRADGLPLGTAPPIRERELPAVQLPLQLPPIQLPLPLPTARATLKPPVKHGERDTEGVPTSSELKALRESKGVTQRELAFLSGVSRGVLSGIELDTTWARTSRLAMLRALSRL